MTLRSASLFSVIAFVVMEIVITLFESSCKHMPADAPREHARAAVLTTSVAAQTADEACARVARANRDAGLARRCADAYRMARVALIGAAEGVDHWTDAAQSRESVTCAVVTASTQIEAIARELTARDQPLPPIVHDANRLVAALGECNDASR